jgi:hypothetical protein
MSVSFTSSGIAGRLVGTYAYDVIYAPAPGASTFKVNMTQAGTGAGNGSETVWITTGGDVVALYALGQNYTGVQAQSLFQVYSAPFELELSVSSEAGVYLASPAVQAVNQTTVKLGPTTMNVTTYQSNSIFTITECGDQATVSTFVLQVGTVPGTNLEAITSWTIQETVAGQQSSLTAVVLSITPT